MPQRAGECEPEDEVLLHERDEGLHERGIGRRDLYWAGAPRNTVACGADLGRLLRLKEHYGIDTAVSRLEQLVLAEFRTHFVTFKVSTLL